MRCNEALDVMVVLIGSNELEAITLLLGVMASGAIVVLLKIV